MINNISITSNNTMMMTPILPSPTPPSIAVEMSTTSSTPIAITATVTATTTPQPPTTTLTTTTITPIAGRIEKPERNLWREQEMLTVLQIIREKRLLPLLNDKTVRSEAVFRRVEKEMFDRGFCKKNFQQIWTKWKFLKSTYMTSRRVHQIPKIIPLEVYESLDELLTAEFQNDGSMSSYDGGDYDEGGGGGNGNSSSMMMSGSYEMMNASASTTGSNDGYLPVISNVQGSLALSSATSTTTPNALFNGGRNYAADLNGFAGSGSGGSGGVGGGVVGVGVGVMRRNKFKNGFRSSFKNEEDTNGFGMQHPIFGYRLGVVKDEPMDDEYENNNSNSAADTSYSHTHLQDEPSNSNSQQFTDIKPELASPPPSPSPSQSQSPSTQQEDDHLPLVPAISNMAHSNHSTNGDSMDGGDTSLIDPLMPPLHRYTPPPYLPLSTQSDQPHHLPPLKQMPFMKIQLPPKAQISQMSHANHHLQHHQHQVHSPPIPIEYKSKKIPVLTLRKRKKRLNIPDLSEGNQSPAPSSKNSKISDEDDPLESPPETSRIPFVTYGKAMREMSSSLREIQREMIDDFFKQQMDLAKSEHEFQKQQDAMLLRCFEDQTKLLLDGARRLFTGLPMATDDGFVNNIE